MHCKIIQIETERILKKRYVTENDIVYDDSCDWFFNTIADYVSDLDDDENALEIATDHLDRPGIHFDPGDRTVTFCTAEYFPAKFDAFKKKLAELQSVTLDDFCRGISFDLTELADLFDDKGGDYVWCDGELVTLDYFIRYYITDGAKYFVGGVLDYHY